MFHLVAPTSHHQMYRSVIPSVLKTSEESRLSAISRMMSCHIVALISETEMRLAEAVGLHQDDLVFDTDVPYVQVREHP